MHSIDLKNYDLRTDLIIETINKDKLPDNINYTSYKEKNVLVEKTDILKNNTNNKEGNYVTISFEDITDKDNRKEIEKVVTKELSILLEKTNIKENDSCLIIGLGNRKSTPDALGPKVIDNVLITRHLFLANANIEEGYRVTSKFIPDVAGNTGIETENIITGIIKYIKPGFIIIVDALKASNINRVNTTIQMSNTGIAPGSGVGNKRKELSSKTLGMPVIAIGVPTIVDAATIVSDTIKFLISKFAYNKKNINKKSSKLKVNDNYLNDNNEKLSAEDKKLLLGLIGNLNDEEIKELIYEVLTPIGYNLMVTPKEIDFLLEQISITISRVINKTLHKNYK